MYSTKFLPQGGYIEGPASLEKNESGYVALLKGRMSHMTSYTELRCLQGYATRRVRLLVTFRQGANEPR